MNRKNYQVCSRCVMDTSDPQISFDSEGACNHCKLFDNVTSKQWYPNEEGRLLLEKIITRIKKDGENKEYDCIIGLSGGIDSSYLAIIMKDMGLRPLVVHVDAGWNSELAVYNIEQVVKHCNYDLHTHVMDWEEIRDLQLAYLKAGVANQDVPQDHAFFASLYHFAVKNGIKYIINGGNIATEGVGIPQTWHHAAMDAINLKAIHEKWGERKLKQYKTISIFHLYFYYPLIYEMKTIRPLNYMQYNKQSALEYLKKQIGYKEYGYKHNESVFTKFFQNYYLPVKFGYDKRRPHLSSMILSGQITRKQALEELSKPQYDPDELKKDFSYIAKKLRITEENLRSLIDSPNQSYDGYQNWDFWYSTIKKAQSLVERLLGKSMKNYS